MHKHKGLLSLIFLVVFLLSIAVLLFPIKILAQEVSGDYYKVLTNGLDVQNDPNALINLYRKGSSTNGNIRIDGNAPTVISSFINLDSNDQEFYLCGFSDQEKCLNMGDASNKPWKIKPINYQIHFEVCGDGPSAAKGKQLSSFVLDKNTRTYANGYIKIKDSKGCNPKKDYFHEGELYRIGLYDDTSMASPFLTSEFYVAHSYPRVKLAIANALSTAKNKTIELLLQGVRPGGPKENNYQVILEGTSIKYKSEQCTTIPYKNGTNGEDVNKNGIVDIYETVGINTQGWDESNSNIIPEHILNGEGWGINPIDTTTNVAKLSLEKKISSDTVRGLAPGSYLLKINEQTRDNRKFFPDDACNGGHTFMHIRFELKYIDGKSKIEIVDVVYDPNEIDDRRSEKILPEPIPPCAPNGYNPETKHCTKFNTAIGEIDLTPKEFILNIYQLILSLAGIVGFFMLLRSGYTLLTSAGDKTKIQEAKSQIISVITGIIFIVIAFVIFETIAIDVLKLPGLSN